MQTLPTKFESILKRDSINFAPLILKVDSDLEKYRRIARFNNMQEAGSLSVITSPPGQGKTTSAYAASTLLKELFNPVVPVPATIALPLREIPKWLSINLPPPSSKSTIVLFDGRESTDDEQGLRDLMGSLNHVVRGRPDLQFVWPTTDDTWRDALVSTARSFGGYAFCPRDAEYSIVGPDRSHWVEAVTLALDQLNSSWDEFGVNTSTAEKLTHEHGTLGDFLTAINQIRVDQEMFTEGVTGLPEVVFVITSHSQIVNHAARLRNPNTYRLRTDEIIGSAVQSEPGKFWRERGAGQQTNLTWISSLLSAKLVVVTPSAVAHACGTESKTGSRLSAAISSTAFRASSSSGRTAFNTTDFARFLKGESVPEITVSNKGKTSDKTLAAFDEIQALSKFQHRDINEAILRAAAKWSKAFVADDVQYEVNLGGDAIADAVVPLTASRTIHLEFNHVSGKRVNSNVIAAYIMRKLRVYATQYNLIAR